MFIISPAQAKEITYTWCAPSTGTPVVYYNVQIEVDGAGWIDIGTYNVDVEGEDGLYTLTVPIGVHRLRVQGVDANGSAGLWSIASEPYEYEGEPGIACQPSMLM